VFIVAEGIAKPFVLKKVIYRAFGQGKPIACLAPIYKKFNEVFNLLVSVLTTGC
jgi:hypothetical protein